MVKNNTGKKVTVLKDELNITGGGIYAVLAYNNVNTNDNNKAVFKVGLAITFQNRITQYETMTPTIYFMGFLANPPIRITRNNQKTKKELYIEIEKFVFKFLTDNGAVRIQSTTRVNNINNVADKSKGGVTELFYCNNELIHTAFYEAQQKYGGNLHLFNLPNFKKETPAKKDILYTGKVVYPK